MTVAGLDMADLLATFGGVFLAIGFLLVLIGLGLNSFVVDKADQYFAPLARKGDPFFKSYIAGKGRLARYGWFILLKRFRGEARPPFAGHPDRVNAIDTAPSWLKLVMVWVYLGFAICIPLAFIPIGLALILDKM